MICRRVPAHRGSSELHEFSGRKRVFGTPLDRQLRANKLEAANREVGVNLMPSAEALLDARACTHAMRLATTRAIVASMEGRPERIDLYRTQREEQRQRVEDAFKKYAALPMTELEKPIWAMTEAGWKQFVTEEEVVWELAKARLGMEADEKQDVIGQLAELKLLQAIVTQAIVTEATRMSAAVEQGMLDVRADAASVTFEYRPIVEAMNHTVEAFVRPLQVTAEYVDRIAKGAIPEKITDRYEGDFNLIKENLNRCIDVVKERARRDDAVAGGG